MPRHFDLTFPTSANDRVRDGTGGSFITRAFCVAIAFICSGCEAEHRDIKQETIAAVARFYEQYNREDFDAIYDGASRGFRMTAKRDESRLFFRTIWNEYGAVKSKFRTSLSIYPHNTHTIIVVEYRTRFGNRDCSDDFSFGFNSSDDSVRLGIYAHNGVTIPAGPPHR